MNMKKSTILTGIFLIPLYVFSQNPALKVQKLILDNGFTVYLNEDQTAKDVYGAVVVKAGSKNDPVDATGMAHYQEHLLFKGTTEMGTSDYQKEKPFLDSINIYYDMLGKTKEESERMLIQKLINNQSIQAAKFGLPTEFDKLMKSIGGTNLNAFTENDMTVYHNSFPGEQTEKWLDLYSSRFQNPVFRSFQSELEVVYEEKNRSMDNFEYKLFETLDKNLFKFHPYGTQSTIGTAEHLKNPPLTKMYAFFNTYYVANNMALVLCGNFDTEKVLPMIKEKFSHLRTGKVPEFPKCPVSDFKKKEVLKVRYTPIKVSVIAYKTFPNVHKDKAAMEVFQNLLSNGSETGRLNKLQRDGKLLGAGSYSYSYNDDGALIFFVLPKLFGQSFSKAEKLVLDEVNKIKQGAISDTDLMIIKTRLYLDYQSRIENCESRTLSIVRTFSEGISWEEEMNYIKQVNKVSKEDVIRIANKYCGENYFVLESKTGFPKKDILKKPDYKPVLTDQKGESEYAKRFKEIKETVSEPRFLDFEKDTKLMELNGSNKLYVTDNPINDIFTLGIEYKAGSDSLKNLDIASNLFSYFHTNNLTTDQVKEAFAMLGLSYSAQCGSNRLYFWFSGLDINFEKSVKLIHALMNESKLENQSVKTVTNEILAGRKASEKIPQNMDDAVFDYARLGNKSSYIDRITNNELKKLKADDLLAIFQKAVTYNAVYHYIGKHSADEVKAVLSENLTLADNHKALPLTMKHNVVSNENKVYFYNDKKAVQSHVHFIVNSEIYQSTPKLNASVTAFNQYMGGGFTGLIGQEIREYRSMAYSPYGYFSKPDLNMHPSYFTSYLGCQADKTIDATEIMDSLISFMPQKPERMDAIKSLMKKSTSAWYPNFRYISYNVDYYRERDYLTNPVKDQYFQYEGLTFDDIMNFYKPYISNKPKIITVYGNKKKIDIHKLSKFGKVQVLKKTDILKK